MNFCYFSHDLLLLKQLAFSDMVEKKKTLVWFFFILVMICLLQSCYLARLCTPFSGITFPPGPACRSLTEPGCVHCVCTLPDDDRPFTESSDVSAPWPQTCWSACSQRCKGQCHCWCWPAPKVNAIAGADLLQRSMPLLELTITWVSLRSLSDCR